MKENDRLNMAEPKQIVGTEELYRLIVENAREYAIFMLDPGGHIVTWNVGAQRLFGYEEAEILGRPASIIFTPEDRARQVPELELQLARATGKAEDERWHLRRDGTSFWASGILTPLWDSAGDSAGDPAGDPAGDSAGDPAGDPAGNLQGFVKILRDNTERKRATENMEADNDRLESYVHQRTNELELTNVMLLEQIGERQLVEKRLRRRNQELSTLNEFSAALSASLSLSTTLDILRALLADQMIIPGGAIFLYDAAEDEICLNSSWGFPPEFLADFTSFTLSGCYFESVVRGQTTLIAEDFREIPFFLELGLEKAREEWRGFVCVPLVAKGVVQGVFGLFCNSVEVCSPEQAAFFETLGRQVGVAVYNARLFAEVKEGRERLQQLAHRVVKAQEEERRRVARELHDEAGQALTGLLLHLEMMRAELGDAPPLLAEGLAEAVDLTSETMESIRRLAHGLRPPSLDSVGLNGVLEVMCHDFARRSRLTIEYQGMEFSSLPDSVTMTFYRVLQEALTNVTKHAQASQVWVRLQLENGEASLVVADDGFGFDRPGKPATKGMGILGMEERLQALGGTFSLQPRPGGGTCLVATTPIEEN
jgi:PAS domain S-box-containing protein